MVIENVNSIPFLYVRIYLLPDGSISHQVYKKKNHTNRYLNASSHHHPSQKSVVLKTLVTRVIRISSPHFLKNEQAHLTKTLLSNGYSLSLSQINQAFRATSKPKPKFPLAIPFLRLSSPCLITKAPLIKS